MSQSRYQSIVESWVNILVGLGINLTINATLFPLMGWNISAHQNLALGVLFTGVSLARSYTLRRLFNRLHRYQENRMDSPDTRPRWMRLLGLYPDPPPGLRDSCDYQGHEFGAQYPDSVCIEGYLWDADSGYSNGEDGWTYTNGGDIPCPGCNAGTWREWARESWFSDAYDAASKGHKVFRRGKRGHRVATFLAQLKGWWLYHWDSRPRWGGK